MTLTYGSLFSGVGGMDLGFDRAGLKCAWQCEINDYARRVLAKHWPDVPKWDDARTFPPPAWMQCECCENFICTWHQQHAHDCDEEECPDLETWDENGINPYEQHHPKWNVDVICGGFPCQDISVSGTGDGLDGERSGLWREFARIIGVLRPRYALIENSPALIVRGLDRVLCDLAALGFDAEWSVVSACSLGAPHTRERLFICAYPACDGLEGRSKRPFEGEPASALDQGQHWKHLPAPRGLGKRNGVPNLVERITGIGNAVVPQVAEFIARRLLESHQ